MVLDFPDRLTVITSVLIYEGRIRGGDGMIRSRVWRDVREM
jgi:hypothetical protein